ncbi:MAG: EscI/YscI/HrpB family type III secretion system inner rod protein [Candidatus Contendobacter sp.]|jgi:hypothetical protein|nr:EscI/YscI/HrpB family type III secretion system inner rod protein [Candidatus Contendobacter sp.]
MIEPIVGYPPVNSLVRLELAQAPPVQLAAVSAADQARFQEALRPPLEITAAPSSLVVAAELGVKQPLTLGDAVLHGLDKMRTGYRDLNDRVEATFQQSSVSPQELLHLQMQVNEVMLGTQLVTQVTSKLQQDMSALLKSS